VSTAKPLEGIRIVDFTWVGAGSFTTKFFADFGAEVIKIESTTRPDQLRRAEPLVGDKGLNESGYFANRNTNKKSITLNMKDPRSVAIVKELIKDSDIVANSFTPNTMEKWGLGYEEVKKVKDDVIYLCMPMQGTTGPHKDFLGYGLTINALIGMIHMNGLPGRPPVGTGTNYPDHVPNPGHAAFAVLSAIEYKNRTGEGQYIELSQVESSISIFPEPLLAYLNNNEIMEAKGHQHPTKIPYGIYRCQGEDRWCALSVGNDQEWESLCQAIPALRNHPHFDTIEKRRANEKQLDEVISKWTIEQTAEDVMACLQGHGIPSGIVQDAEDLVSKDKNLQQRQFWQRLDHAVMGETLYHGTPFKFNKIPTAYRQAAPLIGQHNEELKKWLHLSEEDYQKLLDDRVIQ
jgi:benzylsuccinate CoA-transferase BbsF subunit